MNQIKRDFSIDGMKGTLVILMILGHIVQFFPGGKYENIISYYVNLTTFSGFMFTFGYVSYNAYLSSNISNFILRKKLTKNFFKTLIAFYISGISYTFLLQGLLTPDTILDIIILKRIPGYSEFLLSFSLIYILIYILKPLLKNATGLLIGIFSLFSLLMTYINYESIKIPLLGTLIGTTAFCCFPVIQYSSYFFAGMYLASRQKIYSIFLLVSSIIGTTIFMVYSKYYGNLPQRFPPSATWIIGGYFFIYFYFIVWKKYQIYLAKLPMLCNIGQNTLLYLVFSNIILFTIYRTNIYNVNNRIRWRLLFYLVCFLFCLLPPYLYQKYWIKICSKQK